MGAFLRGKDVIAVLENPKWEAFCLHYAKTGNATESYKQAGYDAKTERAVYSNANRLLKNDKVQARLKELADEMASEKIAGIREIQERLTAILRGDLQEEQVVVEGCGDGISEATIIKRQPQLKDVIKAAETLGKMQGAFDTKSNINVIIPVFGGEDGLED
jgi:phage terminase small subunit